MRVSTFAVFGLFSSVFAAPAAEPVDVEERQIISNTAIIDKAIAAIKASTIKLDNGIKAINSTDLTILLPLDGLATDLTNVIVAQTANIKKSPTIGLLNAPGVAIEAQDLINTVKSTLSDLQSKSKYIFAAFVDSLVLADLIRLKGNADDFVSALKVKVPSIASFLADLDKKQIDTAFDAAIKTFQPKSS